MNKKFLLFFLISGFAVMGGRADFTDFLKKKKPAPAQPRQYLTQEQIRKNQQRYLMEESSRSNGDDVEAKQRAFNDALSYLKDAVAEVGEPRVSNVVVSIMPQRSLLQKTKDFLSGKSEPKPVSIDLVTEAMQKLDAALDAHAEFLKARGNLGVGQVDLNQAQNALAGSKLDFADALRDVEALNKKIAEAQTSGNLTEAAKLNEQLKKISDTLPELTQKMFEHKTNAVMAQEAKARVEGQTGEPAGQPVREAPKPIKKPTMLERATQAVKRVVGRR